MNDRIQEKLKMLRDVPGVYLMKDARGDIIYIGKAVSLKNRVRQYFQSSRNHEPKVIAMVSHVDDFDIILTDTEAEALTLESNLIKQNKPRYNILLKDDKHFPFVRVNLKERFPRAEVVRRVKNDGAKYIGPYLSAMAVQEAMEAVRDNFPLRTCKKDIERARSREERPCLNYHINKCMAPCMLSVSRDDYMAMVDNVVAFLSGKTDEVLKSLEKEMRRASAQLAFERAAVLRDRIRSIETIGQKQKAILAGLDERDVFAPVLEGADTIVYALFLRVGRLVGTERFEMVAGGANGGDVMESFLKQYYTVAGYVPKEIIIREPIADAEGLRAWLSGLRGGKVTIVTPQKGEKKKLADMAFKNGQEYLARVNQQRRREWERHEGALAALSVALGMDELPMRIEAYDISHLKGSDTVGSMVVFIGGKAASKEYRRFKIKTSDAQSDVASMCEILTRRFNRAKSGDKGFAELPALILVDGGKPQLSAAIAAMEQAGADFPVVALAERLEEIFMPKHPEPVILERGSPALHMLQNIRDEAHRFAITYHRSLRDKTALFSELDAVKGIGGQRKKMLYKAFDSLQDIAAATAEELKSKGLDARSARAVHAHFHADGAGENDGERR